MRKFAPYVLAFSKDGSSVHALSFCALADMSSKEVEGLDVALVMLRPADEAELLETNPELREVIQSISLAQSINSRAGRRVPLG